MGTDFAGAVEAVRTSVCRRKVDDEVFGTPPVRKSGAFAEALVTNEKLAVVKPRALSLKAAACLPVVAITAWRAVTEIAHLSQGQTIFVDGCLGNVELVLRIYDGLLLAEVSDVRITYFVVIRATFRIRNRSQTFWLRQAVLWSSVAFLHLQPPTLFGSCLL